MWLLFFSYTLASRFAIEGSLLAGFLGWKFCPHVSFTLSDFVTFLWFPSKRPQVALNRLQTFLSLIDLTFSHVPLRFVVVTESLSDKEPNYAYHSSQYFHVKLHVFLRGRIRGVKKWVYDAGVSHVWCNNLCVSHTSKTDSALLARQIKPTPTPPWERGPSTMQTTLTHILSTPSNSQTSPLTYMTVVYVQQFVKQILPQRPERLHF